MSGQDKKPKGTRGTVASPPKKPPMHAYVSTATGLQRITLTEGQIEPGGVPTQDQDSVRALNAELKEANPTPQMFGRFILASSDDQASAMVLAARADQLERDKAMSKPISFGSPSSGNFSGNSEPEEAEEEFVFEDESEEKKDKDRPPATESQMMKLMVTIASFGVGNTSVNLYGVRSGFQAYKRFPGVGESHQRAMLALALAAVGSVKRIWADKLIQAMKGLGTVPGIFSGNGGTFKAFLILGYDVLKHLSTVAGSKMGWPQWLQVVWENCQRICPNGDIMQAQLLPMDAKVTNKDRNAAIRNAQSIFNTWTRDDTLRYVELLSSAEVQVKGSVTKGNITTYDPNLNKPSGRA